MDVSLCGNLTFLVNDLGRPFTDAGFGNKFRSWCDQAGLKHCTAHGLRKAGATMAANNGATAHQLMSIFGWRTLKMAEQYTPCGRPTAARRIRNAHARYARTNENRITSHRRRQWDFFHKNRSEINGDFRGWCPRKGTIPMSSAIQSSPDLGLKRMVNLHPSSILVRGSPL